MFRSIGWLLPVLFACLVAGGCSTNRPEDEVEILANGATLTRNPTVGLWSEEDRWILAEDLRIGALDGSGPDVFGDIIRLSFAIHPAGRIYVLDGQAQEVRVFDSAGVHIRTFGRGGAGPGEMGWASLAGWGTDGNLWVADPTNGRYSVFTPEGEFVSSYRRDIRFASFPWTGMMDREGRILDMGIRAGTASERVLFRVEPGTGMADTLPLPQYDGPSFDLLTDGVVMGRAPVPFAGQLVWRTDRDGHVWSAITDRYRIVRQGPEGDTLQIIERVATPQPVPAEMKNQAIEHLEDFAARGANVDLSRIPAVMPLISNLAVDDRGYLWVSVAREAGGMGLDVFDPDGRYLGQIDAPVDLLFWPASPIFQDGYLYAFTTDELGSPSLVRLQVGNRGR